MPATVNADDCSGCAECVEVCPCDSIEIDQGVAKVLETCGDCGACESACPTGAITLA